MESQCFVVLEPYVSKFLFFVVFIVFTHVLNIHLSAKTIKSHSLTICVFKVVPDMKSNKYYYKC